MPERIPCPDCAELIMPGAKKCRFCGHWLAPAGQTAKADFSAGAPLTLSPTEEKEPNIPAMVGLPLVLLTGPCVALLFFVVLKQLIQSLMVGAVLALIAVGCGIAGFILANRKSKKTGGLLISIATILIGGLALCSYVVGAVAARAISESAPPSFSPIKQLLGTEKATRIPMKCAKCGNEFEVSSLDLLRQMAGRGMKAYQNIGDINRVLDEEERTGDQGCPCPKCGEPAARPILVCSRCSARFLPPQTGVSGGTAACPECGAPASTMAGLILRDYRLEDIGPD